MQLQIYIPALALAEIRPVLIRIIYYQMLAALHAWSDVFDHFTLLYEYYTLNIRTFMLDVEGFLSKVCHFLS